MSEFEKLVLRGLWIIMKQVMRNGRYLSGTDEVLWCRDVQKATGDDELSPENF